MPVPVFNPLQNQTITSAMVNLTRATADVATSETTTSTSDTDLATAGPAITLSSGVTQDFTLFWSGRMWNSAAAYSVMGVSLAGAAVGTNDDTHAQMNSVDNRYGGCLIATAHASGSADTAKYRVSATTGTWASRRLIGVAI